MFFEDFKGWKTLKGTDNVIPMGNSVGEETILISIGATPNFMEHIGKVDDDISIRR